MSDAPQPPAAVRGTPSLNISQALVLAVFVVAVPSGLLFVLLRSPALDLNWISPEFRTFLLSCSGVLSALIAYWLQREARITFHPAVACLSAGFGLYAALFLFGAWLRNSGPIAWYEIVSTVWPCVFALLCLTLFSWREARQLARVVLQRHPRLLWVALSPLFAACLVIPAAYLRLADQAQGAAAVAWIGPASLAAMAGCLLFAFRIYLRVRTPVVLAFTLSAFLLGLAIIARMLGYTWHLLWWYGHNLQFVSLFLAAYGILEGNRSREREALITELAALSKKLEEQSMRDPLTGCYNRRFMQEALENELRKARRTRLPLALLVLDADNFKAINDNLGHLFGDFVLVEMAGRMRAVMRTSDVFARCGGEEFYVLLPQTNRVGGQEVASKILAAVRDLPFDNGESSIRTTVSIGIADTLTPGVEDVPSLIEAADRALYAAKRAGKDRAVTLEPLAFHVPFDKPAS